MAAASRRADRPGGGRGEQMQIGEAAARVGLSIRTIRHYEEVGLIVPSARSAGGFRLYTEPDLARLRVVREMKPLGFALEEMREVLSVIEALHAEPAPAKGERAVLWDRLATFHDAARQRVRALGQELAMAQQFADNLRAELDETGAPPHP